VLGDNRAGTGGSGAGASVSSGGTHPSVE